MISLDSGGCATYFGYWERKVPPTHPNDENEDEGARWNNGLGLTSSEKVIKKL